MDELTFSDTKLCPETFTPYMDVSYTFRIAIDREMFVSLEVIGKETMESLLACRFKQLLEEKLPERLPNIKNGMRKYMEGKEGVVL